MLLEEVIGVGIWELTLAVYTMFLALCQTLAQISEGWAGREQKKKKKKRCSAPRTAPGVPASPTALVQLAEVGNTSTPLWLLFSSSPSDQKHLK